jgi:hypothetical protein
MHNACTQGNIKTTIISVHTFKGKKEKKLTSLLWILIVSFHLPILNLRPLMITSSISSWNQCSPQIFLQGFIHHQRPPIGSRFNFKGSNIVPISKSQDTSNKHLNTLQIFTIMQVHIIVHNDKVIKLLNPLHKVITKWNEVVTSAITWCE